MSVSLYYTATRTAPLTPEERASIKAVLEEFSVEDQMNEQERTGEGISWEPLDFYDDDPDEPETILKGSVNLPLNSAEAAMIGLEHWRTCLTAIRRKVAAADWRVALEDNELIWTENDGWSMSED